MNFSITAATRIECNAIAPSVGLVVVEALTRLLTTAISNIFPRGPSPRTLRCYHILIHAIPAMSIMRATDTM
jgi:hypothetical protein